ncbi:glycosyltransferase family 4 protein [Nocardioides gansuensis]|nr:glycosyltransferase family 1 protein [Nocardioides gansuensis]
MRVLVEALAAEFGGIRTYVDALVEAWPHACPEDEVHLLVREEHPGLPGPTLPGVTLHRVPVPGPAVVGRAWVQTREVSRLARTVDADVVLATLPATTLRHPGLPLAVVVHDLRHELRPGQFSRIRRWQRSAAYGRSYRLADGFCAVSQRTLDDLHTLHPATRGKPSVVAHHGSDHVDSWQAGDRPGGHAVAFAHQPNKNLDLVLDGWTALGADAPRLVVTGVGADRDAVATGITERGLSTVELAPYLPEPDFQALLASAGLVVFPSDFEGFGLPVVEAMRLGIPVVIGPEPATREAAGGHAFELAGFTPGALATAVRAALAVSPAQRQAARTHAATFTWRRTVSQTRSLLASLL